MAIAFTTLTSGSSTTNASTYTNFSASITPASDTVVFCVIGSRVNAGSVNAVTITGCGLTWTTAYTSATSGGRCIQVAWGAGTPSTGQLTAAFAGQTQTHLMWSVFEFSGADTSAPIVQQNNTAWLAAGSDPVTVSLSAFASADNATLGCLLTQSSGITAIAPDSSPVFTEIHEVSQSENAGRVETQYYLGNSTTIDWTVTGTGNFRAFALELKAAGAAANLRRYTMPLTGVG